MIEGECVTMLAVGAPKTNETKLNETQCRVYNLVSQHDSSKIISIDSSMVCKQIHMYWSEFTILLDLENNWQQ